MSRSTDSYHHGDLEAELERAALALLADHSAAGLSLREVARRAGVSHNAPYHHFGDRRGLLKRVAERSMEELVTAQRAARAAAADPAAQLVAVGLAYVTFAAEHAHAFTAVFDPEICVPGSPTPGMAPLIAANEELMAEVVSAVWGPDELEARCAGLWGAVHGLATLVLAGHLPLSAAEPALRATALPRASGR